ncbi:ABC transporter ATP-binding protein [Thermodesulfobacteriota bacterium]
MAQLQIEMLTSGYRSADILSGINLYVEKGEIVSLIGPNGAGKSTLLRTISGLLPCRKGKKHFEDEDITKLPAHRITRLGIAQVPEGKQIFGTMTVYQNLLLGCYSNYSERGVTGRQKLLDQVFDIFPVLGQRQDQKAGTLSGGEQQMLAVGRALMAEPKLLLLDEPSLGLSPKFIDVILEVLVKLVKSGISILLAEQNAMAALGIANRAYVLELGHVVLEGDSKQLAQEEKVKEVYLGTGATASPLGS